jgi:apolipoprotein N-acyltransferase
MASNPDRARTGALAVAAIAATAVLAFVGTGLHPLAWATWLAPLPVLLVAPRLSARAAFAASAFAWLLGGSNEWTYVAPILFAGHGGPPFVIRLLAVTLIFAGPAVGFGLVVALWRRLVLRSAPGLAVLAAPAAWTGFEYLTSLVSPHGTFGDLAYEQMDVLPIVQLASATGLWGVTFCLWLAPAAVAALVWSWSDRRKASAVGASVVAAFAVALGFGLWRLQSPPAGGPTVRVGLVASDAPAYVYPSGPGPDATRTLEAYAAQADALARRGAQVVVLPEKLAVVVDTPAEQDRLFQAVADRTGAEIVVGLVHATSATEAPINEARIYAPRAGAPLSYAKQHLLPGPESPMRPGRSLLIQREPTGLWGAAICKDMDFPDPSRAYGAAGVGLLLVPAWDFVDDAWLHDRMAVMRGVEHGFPIARVAKQGLMTVTDDRGRVLAERSSRATRPFSSLIADVPVRHERTLYARFGDWFAWLCLAAAALCIAAAARPRRG